MATQFLTRVKSKLYHPKPAQPPQSQSQPQPEPELEIAPDFPPILDNDDEAFLARVISESLPAAAAAVDEPVSAETRDAQIESLNDATNTPLPSTPVTEQGRGSMDMGEGAKGKEEGKWSTKKMWGMLRRQSTGAKEKGKERRRSSHGKRPSQDIVPPPTTKENTQETTQDTTDESKVIREQQDIADVLDKLNLAALNNRVFSVNEETRILLQKFKLILKDLLNGVPEAYNDLENLLKNRDQQIEELFNSLPGFLQKLVAQLPESLTPEILATLAAKAEKSGAMNLENKEKAAKAAGKIKTFSKDWVTKPTAILGFLRSIMAYLRARFPALIGMNVLWSLALCLLLLSLWYCHKRGREVRLEKEASEAESSGSSERVDAQQHTSSLDDAENKPSATSADGPAVAEGQADEEVGTARLARFDSAISSYSSGRGTSQKVEPYEGT